MNASPSVIPSLATVDAPRSTPPYAGGKAFSERMALLRQLNEQAGFRMPETIVPEGTALIAVGEEKKRALQQKMDALPFAVDALPAFLAAENALVPFDRHADLSQLRMRPNGKLYRLDNPKGGEIGYTHTGLSQALSFVGQTLGQPRNFCNGLEFLSPSPRAGGFNDVMERYAAVAPRDDKGNHPTHVMRTILHPSNGERFLRAVTSTRHVLDKGDGRAIAKALQVVLPKGAKIRISRTWDRIDFEAFFPMMNREILVGDVVLGRASISISETKDISAEVIGGLLRALCLNFTTAWYGGASIFNTKHMGEGFTKRISEAFAEKLDAITPFVQAFGDGYKIQLPEAYPTRAEVVARVAKVYTLPEETATATIASWDMDGAQSAGNTLAGLANALTRASQEETMEAGGRTEKVAGVLIGAGWNALQKNLLKTEEEVAVA